MTGKTKHSSLRATALPAIIADADGSSRHDGWTRDRMIGFLESLVETGSVSLAAESVGMTRQTAYRLRARLIGQPFDHAWDAALEFGLQQLHHEALDRAMNGVPVPVFYGGEQVGERRVFPEGLTRFLLDNPNRRARDPEIRALALREWNAMMARVQTGPIVWTPLERKKAEIANKALAEYQLPVAKTIRPRKRADARQAVDDSQTKHDEILRRDNF